MASTGRTLPYLQLVFVQYVTPLKNFPFHRVLEFDVSMGNFVAGSPARVSSPSAALSSAFVG